jgi:hypothetical protein
MSIGLLKSSAQGPEVSVARPPSVSIQADLQVDVHRDLALDPLDDPDDVVIRLARRHEVDHARAPRGRRDLGLEDEGVSSIVTLDAAHRGRRSDCPVAVLIAAEELREARIGVDARQAEPVDGAVLGDQRHRARVTDEPVVLDVGRHSGIMRMAARDRNVRCRWARAPCQRVQIE